MFSRPPLPPLCYDALVVHRLYYLWPGLLRGKTFRMFLELLVALRLKVPLSCSAILSLSQACSASANIIFPTCLLTSMHSLFQQESLLTIREQQLQCEIQTVKIRSCFQPSGNWTYRTQLSWLYKSPVVPAIRETGEGKLWLHGA